MKKNSIFFLIIAVILTIIGLLLINHWAFSGLIITIAIYYGLRLVCKNGKIWWQKKESKVAKRERFLMMIISLMFLFLATGTALYLWAFCNETPLCDHGRYQFVNAEYLLRSLAASFQLFTANIDSNVLDTIHTHPYIKGMISVQAVLSFSCTVAVFISLAYARFNAYIKLHKQTKVDNGHNHLYVFFGMNEPSRLLAKCIREKEKEQAFIIFVENPRMADDDQSGWNNIVGMFIHRRQTFMEADDINARVTFCETKLCDVVLENKNITDVLGEMNLLKLKELILKLSMTQEAKLHVFLFSENEDENIRAMSVLAADSTINEVNKNIRQCFYCHARRNGLNRVVEDIAVKRGLEVRIIDSSYLSIELLKADEKNHPVQLVDVDKNNPTTVKSEFNSLIVGFDETGQDALKFLYEFGAFVDSEATPENEYRSPFYCVATDKRMDDLRGVFANSAPAAMCQYNMKGRKMIELKQCDCQSSEFYTAILNNNFAKKLNYVVIVVGNDELGMQLAIRILNHIRREREDLSRLRIYVRSYRSDKESYMQKIADYYNEGYNKDNEKKKSYQTEAIIIPFGQKEKIYSYEMIINEELIQKGRKYQASYARLKRETKLWDTRHKELQEMGSLNSIRKLRRQELQDLGNALHADTKIHLLKKAMGEGYDWDDFMGRYFDEDNMPICKGSYDKIEYPLLTNHENKVILNLARLEHIRWNASHEMLGYTKAHAGLHSCDERTREHNCLRPWQELDEESRETLKSDWPSDYKSYDFSVVDNSILLNKEKLLSNESK
jgi:hypothetical protein